MKNIKFINRFYCDFLIKRNFILTILAIYAIASIVIEYSAYYKKFKYSLSIEI